MSSLAPEAPAPTSGKWHGVVLAPTTDTPAIERLKLLHDRFKHLNNMRVTTSLAYAALVGALLGKLPPPSTEGAGAAAFAPEIRGAALVLVVLGGLLISFFEQKVGARAFATACRLRAILRQDLKDESVVVPTHMAVNEDCLFSAIPLVAAACGAYLWGKMTFGCVGATWFPIGVFVLGVAYRAYVQSQPTRDIDAWPS